ncbi:MAG TPA: hypothetical protein PK098_00795 [Phycisphaerales bacterium]|nr:hypothetical protein [Phycisphaerales bacterium]
MNPFVSAYQRLDLMQRTLWFRLAMTGVALACCAYVFGSLLFTSYSLDSQRRVLVTAIESQNLNNRDEHAVSFADRGVIIVGGREYRTREFIDNPSVVFDERGYFAVPRYLVEELLADQVPLWAPTWLLDQPNTTWLLAVVGTVWLLLIVWMELSLPFLLTLTGTGLAALVFRWMGSEQGVLAAGGIGLLVFTYVLLTRAALLLMDRPNQILAVAHTVIKEASRSRISLVFIVILLVLLPLLPLWLDPGAPLRHRVQTFISRSVGLTFVIAACMTLFLSCATVAFEIRDRQIWSIVTKPMSRFNYLVGKWLGVVTVNLILLLMAGVSTFTFIQYLRTTPVQPGIVGQLDRVQLENEVLTARVSTRPVYEQLTVDQVRERIEQIIASDPEMYGREVTLAERRDLAEQIRQTHAASQRSIPPNSRMRTYRFEGLGEAAKRQATLALRYRFYIMRSDVNETFPAIFIFNEDNRTIQRRTYVPTMSHEIILGSDMIREDGTLLVSIVNMFEPPPHEANVGALFFDEKDFELRYTVAGFEGNFFRAVMVAWIKLSFLAMLGIACSTFLSFPVAALLSFTIFIAGTMGPFLALSLTEYEPLYVHEVDWTNVVMVIQWAFGNSIRLIAEFLVFSLGPFGELKPTESLVEGRLIPWGRVINGFAVIGVFWSGVAALVGFLVIRSRQLAIYSGQG